ncbi:hypothetical protein A9W97_17630 [Mycobacterium gordonae]|nr:PPE family protein [Mycobacterium gordonae]OBJ87434.1 hypothetical protein A9W97_17630 [Mycobacterium gordonae]
MDFAMKPPEINTGRMYAGSGSGPMLVAAQAWDELAAQLYSTAAAAGSVIAGLTGEPWRGPASASMAAATTPYVSWLGTTAAHAEQVASQARAAAAAYEAAFATTVPPQMIAANRDLLLSLVEGNTLGQNAPAIAATQADYGEMWAQDTAAMYGYAAASAHAATLTSLTPPPTTANPAGLAGPTAVVAQAESASSAANTQAVLSQLTSAVPTVLQGLASPSQATSAATSVLTGILRGLGFNTPLDFLSLVSIADAGLGSTGLATASGAWGSASQASAAILTNQDQMTGTQGLLHSMQGQISRLEGQILHRLDQLGTAPGGPAAVSADVGRSASVGPLSVPHSWVTAAPAVRLAVASLPGASLSTAPAAEAGSLANLIGATALASMAGRALAGTRIAGHASGGAAPVQDNHSGPTVIVRQATPTAE